MIQPISNIWVNDAQYLIANHYPQFNDLSKSTLRDLLISSSDDPSRSWAASGTSDLVIYMVGDASAEGGSFPLIKGGDGESLTMNELNQWLNALQKQEQEQGHIQGTVTVIQEGDYSGNLVQSLDTYENKSRVVISSSAAHQASQKRFDRNFSQYFWNQISLGNSVREAFKEARSRLRRQQHAQINLDGDKNSNGKNEIPYAHYHLGFGMAVASDEPVIGKVSENTTLDSTTQNTLWASNIDTLSPLTKVWAVIEPPDYDPVNHQTGELVEVQLTDDDQDGQWEATWGGFNAVGIYAVHYYAMDQKYSISAPHTSYVTQTIGPDAYEVDDTLASASLLSANTHYRQWHNFHSADDVDHIQFYANRDYGQYTIKVDSINSQADTVVTLYDACSTDAEALLDVDDAPSDSYELIYWTPPSAPSAGFYYLKIKPYDENSVHADSENGYILNVFPTNAPQEAVVKGTVKGASGSPIVGARVYTSSNQSDKTNGQGEYALSLKEGSVTLMVEAVGYGQEAMQLQVKAEDSLQQDFELQLDSGKPIDLDPGDKAVRPMKPPKTEIEAGHNGPVIMQVMEITVPDGGAGLHKLTLTSRGTGNEATDIRSVKLYHDINRNDVVDPGDPLVGSGKTFTRDNGSITFNFAGNGNPYAFGTPGPQRILVTFERK